MILGMKNILFSSALAMSALVGCGEAVSPSRAKRAAEDSGFTDVVVLKQHGFSPGLYGCDEHDDVAFEVSAKNPKGDQVSMTVCCGLVWKGCTIRH